MQKGRFVVSFIVSGLFHMTVFFTFAIWVSSDIGRERVVTPVFVNIIRPAMDVSFDRCSVSWSTTGFSKGRSVDVSRYYEQKVDLVDVGKSGSGAVGVSVGAELTLKFHPERKRSDIKFYGKSAALACGTSAHSGTKVVFPITVKKKRLVSSSHTAVKKMPYIASHVNKSLGSAKKQKAGNVKKAIPVVDINQLKFKKKVVPEYPFLAREMGYEGRVLVKFMVLRDGSVSDVRVVHSSGRDVLDKAAVIAVKKWIFYPIGKPVWVKTELIFVLKE